MSRAKKPPVMLVPDEQLSVGSRIQFFRLSYSPCGTKQPQTRQELAALANIQSCTLKEIEEGIREPRPESLKRLKEALGVRMWMLTGPIERFVEAVAALKLQAELITVWIAKSKKDAEESGANWASDMTRQEIAKEREVRAIAKARWRQEDKKRCLGCDIEFGPPEGISKYDWDRRSCCGRSCSRKAVRTQGAERAGKGGAK